MLPTVRRLDTLIILVLFAYLCTLPEALRGVFDIEFCLIVGTNQRPLSPECLGSLSDPKHKQAEKNRSFFKIRNTI